jgi:hypothetical protein
MLTSLIVSLVSIIHLHLFLFPLIILYFQTYCLIPLSFFLLTSTLFLLHLIWFSLRITFSSPRPLRNSKFRISPTLILIQHFLSTFFLFLKLFHFASRPPELLCSLFSFNVKRLAWWTQNLQVAAAVAFISIVAETDSKTVALHMEY